MDKKPATRPRSQSEPTGLKAVPVSVPSSAPVPSAPEGTEEDYQKSLAAATGKGRRRRTMKKRKSHRRKTHHRRR